ncbi:MAG: LacI family DNA-binding transcriptional regulator, partial [Verrucomicrobiota bacterium]
MNWKDQRPVTMRDLAKAAGVSPSTASRALREASNISRATQQRVKRIANEMGYSLDPVKSVLSNYTRKSSQTTKPIGIALVSSDLLLPHWSGVIPAAKAQAAKFGYSCIHYSWDPKLSSREHSRILKEKGIKGIIIGPVFNNLDLEEPDLDWDDFSVISWGRFIAKPRLDCILENSFESMRLALDKCRENGYERPGFLNIRRNNNRSGLRPQAAFATYSDLHPDFDTAKELIIDDTKQCEQVSQWLRTEKVETIITNHFVLAELVDNGLELRGDLRIVTLDLHKSQTHNHKYSGVIRDDIHI